MPLNIVKGYTFDDVLLSPRHSPIKSRSEIDLSVQLSKNLKFAHPIIPANMKTITDGSMAQIIAETGGLAILHRFMSLEEQLEIVNKFVLMTKEGTPDYMVHIGVSVGVKKEDYKNVDALRQLGAEIFCIDIAHGDSKHCIDMVKYISKTYPDVFLIAGNVATAEGAERLWMAGADCVKVGVGPGSLCTTRIETGNGFPQLTALSKIFDKKMELLNPTYHYAKPNEFEDGKFGFRVEDPPAINKPIFIIADGGLKSAGDCVKALCFADMVMAGNLFAGAIETPGEIVRLNGKQYKNYVGSSTHKTNHIEGVAALVPAKGKTVDIIIKITEGIKSGLSYQGCKNLLELKEDPQFVQITNAGLKESHAHIEKYNETNH